MTRATTTIMPNDQLRPKQAKPPGRIMERRTVGGSSPLARLDLGLPRSGSDAAESGFAASPAITQRSICGWERRLSSCGPSATVPASLAAGPCQPGIEATPRDTERLAHPQHWPYPSVLRDEAELHVDSFAK